MATEQTSPANKEKMTAEKPIELNDSELEHVKGGTATRDVVEADPCAGGKARAR